MDQVSQNQTSFIPRKALGHDPAIREKSVGLFLIISTLLFAITILGSAGVFAYKYFLNKGIEASSTYLNERKAALEPTTINDLSRTDKRLRSASILLNGHIVVTPVFGLLESLTLKTVRFSRFDYVSNEDKTVSLKLSGEAKNYGSVALQADTLNAEKRFVKSAVFSNLNLDDKGNITFDAVITLDPDLTNYKKSLSRETVAPPTGADTGTGNLGQ